MLGLWKAAIYGVGRCLDPEETQINFWMPA
jgi:hypothetical protein